MSYSVTFKPKCQKDLNLLIQLTLICSKLTRHLESLVNYKKNYISILRLKKNHRKQIQTCLMQQIRMMICHVGRRI